MWTCVSIQGVCCSTCVATGRVLQHMCFYFYSVCCNTCVSIQGVCCNTCCYRVWIAAHVFLYRVLLQHMCFYTGCCCSTCVATRRVLQHMCCYRVCFAAHVFLFRVCVAVGNVLIATASLVTPAWSSRLGAAFSYGPVLQTCPVTSYLVV